MTPEANRQAREGEEGQVAEFSIEELMGDPEWIRSFGIDPIEDPESGRKFYLWDHMFNRNDEGMPVPNYTVQETAKFFFGKGPDWLRWRYRAANNYPQGYFVLDGVELTAKRTEKGNRYYTLADVERMAHALLVNRAIDPGQFTTIIQLVLLQARRHRVVRDVPPL